MKRAQAKRCTQRELAYLSFWRRKGVMIRIDEPIPMSTVTPPSYATRNPFRDAMLALGIIIGLLGMLGFALGMAAGIL